MQRLLVSLIAALVPALVLAAPYTDARLGVRFNVPPGWRVQPETLRGERVLRVIPPKADQRERAAIDVSVRVGRVGRKDTLERFARRLSQPAGEREAARWVRLDDKVGRLGALYREGHFVDNHLWIVRNTLMVALQIGRTRAEARCSATAAEYKTWRRPLESVCWSLEFVAKPRSTSR